MAYHLDQQDENAIVMDGHAEGIAPSPYEGISDMRNVNIISVPDEASVNFATSKISQGVITGSVTSANAGAGTVTVSSATGLENNMAIIFSVVTVGGVSVGSNPYRSGSIYWIGGLSGNTFQLYDDYAQTSLVNITSSGTGTFSTLTMAQPHYFATTLHNLNTPNSGINNNKQWLVDQLGQVWSNWRVTGTNSYWTYTGNKVPNANRTNGNGLVAYQTNPTLPGANYLSYLFVFHDGSIDYVQTNATSLVWKYQWNPSAGTPEGYQADPTAANPMNTPNYITASHEALVGQDNVVYYCDSSFLGSFYENNGQVFNPAVFASYTFTQQALGLPTADNANCLAELGTDLLVGGQLNKIYPWDRTVHVNGLSVNSSYRYPILIGEYNIQKMVTINTNTYIFAGNRGRIYTTNGSQAQLYKKLPDHLSGTVEPYYTWGGTCFAKNQLYFSFSVTTNAGTAITTTGGLWAIDLDTKAIRLTNELSYGTYAGYATALINPVPVINAPTNPAGVGLFMGWDNGSSGYGVDTTTSAPYTGSQAYIDYDLIPIGTFYRPKVFKTVEYKLSVPMVSGESVAIYYRLNFNDSYTLIFTSSTAGFFSDNHAVNFSNSQWVQLRAVINSTASTPSYTRLEQIRIK